MKHSITILLCFGIYLNCICQEKKIVNRDSSYSALDVVSYFWQLDSLGKSGYRLCTYNQLLNSEIQKITFQEIIKKLGKPNLIQKDIAGISYCYYFFDGREIPKSEGYSEELLYIYFRFNKGSIYLQRKGINGVDY